MFREFKPMQKYYDFTRMTDEEIELELCSVRNEIHEYSGDNIIEFADYKTS